MMTTLWQYFTPLEWFSACGVGIGGFITGPPAPPTVLQQVRACERKIAQMIREHSRALEKYKARNAELKATIKQLCAKGANRADRKVTAAAYELHVLAKDTAKLYCFIAHLKSLANEVCSARIQMRRGDVIENTIGVMRVLNAINPPAQTVGMMRDFAREMNNVGLAEQEASEMFDRVNNEEDEPEEVESRRLELLVTDILNEKPQSKLRVIEMVNTPVVDVREPVAVGGTDPDDLPSAPNAEPLAEKNMRDRLDALRR